MIAIMDYGVGNLFSLKSSLAQLGQDTVVTADPDTIRKADRLILPGAGAKQGELGVVPCRDNRDPDGKAQQRSGLRQQGADRLACFNQPREQAARQAGRLQDWRAEIALPEIEHLAGARHGEVGGELPGQPMVDQR